MTMPTSAKRRSLLQFLGTAPLVAGLTVEGASAAGAHAAASVGAAAAGKAYQPKFFTAHEWQTVRMLTDLILPKDERSGSATDAGVPEFMDFIMTDPAVDDRSREARQVSMRGGLAWLDNQSRERSGKTFVAATDAERIQLLDAVAYWKGDDPEEYEDHPTDKRVLPMAPWPGVLQFVPRPHGFGLLQQQDGRRRHRLHWQHRLQLDGPAAGSDEEARRVASRPG